MVRVDDEERRRVRPIVAITLASGHTNAFVVGNNCAPELVR